MASSGSDIIGFIDENIEGFKLFITSVTGTLLNSEAAIHGNIHSIKSRIKSTKSIRDKILRKEKSGITINKSNCFSEITDLAGVRIFYLTLHDFNEIHNLILNHVNAGEWVLKESPIAYTWDPKFVKIFKDFGLLCKRKQSSYTSVHYLISPNSTSDISCEIQVRTLLEEAWGEIDHKVNYPHPTKNRSCAEQLHAFSRIVSAAVQLSNSIIETHRKK